MPYTKFTCYKKGVKKYCTRNTRNGNVTHYSSEQKRDTGIRMHEMYSHGFQPTRVTQHTRKGRTVRSHYRR